MRIASDESVDECALVGMAGELSDGFITQYYVHAVRPIGVRSPAVVLSFQFHIGCKGNKMFCSMRT